MWEKRNTPLMTRHEKTIKCIVVGVCSWSSIPYCPCIRKAKKVLGNNVPGQPHRGFCTWVGSSPLGIESLDTTAEKAKRSRWNI